MMSIRVLPEDIKIGSLIFVPFKGANCLSIRKVKAKQGIAIHLCDPKYDNIGNWYELIEDFTYGGEYMKVEELENAGIEIKQLITEV